MLVPALPQIQHRLGLSLGDATWTFSALALSGAVATPLLGRAADIWGARRIFTLTSIVLMLGILLSATASSFTQLLAGQIMQGFALSFLPLSIAVSREVEDADAAKYIVIAATSSTVAGFFFASLLLQLSDYRVLYWVAVPPIGLCTLAAIVNGGFKARGVAAPGARIDVASGALLAVAFVSFLTSFGANWRALIGHLVVSLTALIAWWVRSRRSEQPLIDIGLFNDRVVGSIAAIAATTGAGAFASFVIIPVMVESASGQGGMGGTPTLSGVLLSGFGIFGAISPLMTGWLRIRTSSSAVLQIGTSAILIGLLVLLLPASSSTLFVASSAIGAGIGLVLTQAIDSLSGAVPIERLASASAAIFVTKSLGHATGAQAASHLLGTLPSVAASAPSVGFAASCCLIALLIGRRLPSPSAIS